MGCQTESCLLRSPSGREGPTFYGLSVGQRVTAEFSLKPLFGSPRIQDFFLLHLMWKFFAYGVLLDFVSPYFFMDLCGALVLFLFVGSARNISGGEEERTDRQRPDG